MLIQLALHGASQKAGDSYASAKSATDGTDIDPNDWAMEQCAATIEQLYNDDWSVRRAGGGTTITDLARALAEVMPEVSESDAAARLADASKEDKAALRSHPQVKAVLERLRAERATAKAEAAAKSADTSDAPALADLF